jgi:hypothetical protein
MEKSWAEEFGEEWLLRLRDKNEALVTVAVIKSGSSHMAALKRMDKEQTDALLEVASQAYRAGTGNG